MGYGWQTLAQARQQLRERLYDTASSQFWTDTELNAIISDSLRQWNALTSFWRGDFTFPPIYSQSFYDLTAQANTLRPLTVTDQSIFTDIEYSLLEPPVGAGPWTGSSQFSIDDILGAVQRRRDEILSITGCTISSHIVPALPGRTFLPDTVTEIRRIAWLTATGTPLFVDDNLVAGNRPGTVFTLAGAPSPSSSLELYWNGLLQTQGVDYNITGAVITMVNTVNPGDQLEAFYRTTQVTGARVWKGDTWEAQAFEPQYTTNVGGTPNIYMESAQPPLSFDVDVPPGVPSQYEALTLDSGPPLTTSGPTTMNIPDDWTWVIRYGALADLLSRDSEAKDLPRAQYCEARYRQGLELLRGAPALLAFRVNNVPVQIDSVTAVDSFFPAWQSVDPGQPSLALTEGLNLIALSPSPDISPYGLMATVVTNAPLPASDGAYIQLGRDEYDAVLDLCEHSAMFKAGGTEFLSSTPLLERFLKVAAFYNSKLITEFAFQKFLYMVSQRDAVENPRTEDVNA